MITHKNRSFLNRLGFASQGILGAFKAERSLRVHAAGVAFVLVFCLILRPSLEWCAAFAICCALVVSLELVNTAVEALLDVLHPAQSKQIGFAKDCLAGAVLIASLISVLVFVLYLVRHFGGPLAVS
ncbi:MAG: diacylglycerol kinase [Bdellovibrionaceae bacterium]|nr:diacylglycerol kinase [Pseudobdellovibrionaceae bacterium]